LRDAQTLAITSRELIELSPSRLSPEDLPISSISNFARSSQRSADPQADPRVPAGARQVTRGQIYAGARNQPWKNSGIYRRHGGVYYLPGHYLFSGAL